MIEWNRWRGDRNAPVVYADESPVRVGAHVVVCYMRTGFMVSGEVLVVTDSVVVVGDHRWLDCRTGLPGWVPIKRSTLPGQIPIEK